MTNRRWNPYLSKIERRPRIPFCWRRIWCTATCHVPWLFELSSPRSNRLKLDVRYIRKVPYKWRGTLSRFLSSFATAPFLTLTATNLCRFLTRCIVQKFRYNTEWQLFKDFSPIKPRMNGCGHLTISTQLIKEILRIDLVLSAIKNLRFTTNSKHWKLEIIWFIFVLTTLHSAYFGVRNNYFLTTKKRGE